MEDEHRSHFGSRYKSGWCSQASLFLHGLAHQCCININNSLDVCLPMDLVGHSIHLGLLELCTSMRQKRKAVATNLPLQRPLQELLWAVVPALQRAPAFTCSVASLRRCADHQLPGCRFLRCNILANYLLAWGSSSVQLAMHGGRIAHFHLALWANAHGSRTTWLNSAMSLRAWASSLHKQQHSQGKQIAFPLSCLTRSDFHDLKIFHARWNFWSRKKHCHIDVFWGMSNYNEENNQINITAR